MTRKIKTLSDVMDLHLNGASRDAIIEQTHADGASAHYVASMMPRPVRSVVTRADSEANQDAVKVRSRLEGPLAIAETEQERALAEYLIALRGADDRSAHRIMLQLNAAGEASAPPGLGIRAIHKIHDGWVEVDVVPTWSPPK